MTEATTTDDRVWLDGVQRDVCHWLSLCPALEPGQVVAALALDLVASVAPGLLDVGYRGRFSLLLALAPVDVEAILCEANHDLRMRPDVYETAVCKLRSRPPHGERYLFCWRREGVALLRWSQRQVTPWS